MDLRAVGNLARARAGGGEIPEGSKATKKPTAIDRTVTARLGDHDVGGAGRLGPVSQFEPVHGFWDHRADGNLCKRDRLVSAALDRSAFLLRCRARCLADTSPDCDAFALQHLVRTDRDNHDDLGVVAVCPTRISSVRLLSILNVTKCLAGF